MGREASSLVRSGLRALIVNNFDIGNVANQTALPAITQRLTNRTSEPYIYLRSDSSSPIDISRSSRPRDYTTAIEVVTRADTNEGGPRQRDEIADEVVRILDRTPPVIRGFCVSISVVDEVSMLDNIEEESGTFFKATIFVVTRVVAEASGVIAPGTNPVQDPIFGFQGFMFTPTQNRIELHDAGMIVPNAVYPSNNNGFDFVSVDYTSTGEGVLDAGVLTVGAEDVPSISSVITYESEADNTDIRTNTANTFFIRIMSLRAGVLDGTSLDVASLNSDVIYGTVDPNGTEISYTGTLGQRGYIAYDAALPDLTAITQQRSFGSNLLPLFTRSVSDGYKIYIQNTPLQFQTTIFAILAT